MIFMLINISFFFFFNDTATTEIYTLSLHDALPIYQPARRDGQGAGRGARRHDRPMTTLADHAKQAKQAMRSEEHTSELQSPCNLVCRLLLEKKKQQSFQSTAELRYYTPTP